MRFGISLAATLSHNACRRSSAEVGQEGRKYRCLDDNFLAVPVCVETLKSCGPAAVAFVSAIGRRMYPASGERDQRTF